MPPKWSLGYHQCRWSYDSSEKVLKVFSWQSALSLSMCISFSEGNMNILIIFYTESVLLGYFLVPQVVRTFRKKGIPCDVVWMDIDYMDGFRCFTFDSVSTGSVVFAT